MAQADSGTLPVRKWSVRIRHSRPADSFGIVLALTLLDYVAVSTLLTVPWGRVAVNVLLGLTLLFSLRTSRSARIWQLLATLFLISSALAALTSTIGGSTVSLGPTSTIVGWLLLLTAPLVILRRISTHRVVTTETVLGAVCVYLLIGFSFTALYAAIGFWSAVPFFVATQGHDATINEYLFFSYSTLTTVGYGNLVPAGNLGQTFAMLEALCGQIYLVIIVARLVSLWGPGSAHRQQRKALLSPPSEQPHDDLGNEQADEQTTHAHHDKLPARLPE